MFTLNFTSTEAPDPVVPLLCSAAQRCCDSQSLLRFQDYDQPLAHAHIHMHTKHYLSSEVAHQWNNLPPLEMSHLHFRPHSTHKQGLGFFPQQNFPAAFCTGQSSEALWFLLIPEKWVIFVCTWNTRESLSPRGTLEGGKGLTWAGFPLWNAPFGGKRATHFKKKKFGMSEMGLIY